MKNARMRKERRLNLRKTAGESKSERGAQSSSLRSLRGRDKWGGRQPGFKRKLEEKPNLGRINTDPRCVKGGKKAICAGAVSGGEA